MWLVLACSTPEPGATAPRDATAPEPELQAITLALNWYPEPEFGGFYEGVLGGHYAAAGFDVTIVPGGPGAPTLELLESGRAQVAITAADELLVKREKGVSAVGVWPAFQLAPNGIMVHTGSGAERFEDLVGLTVAIELGSPFQTFLWQRYGWAEQVTPVPYGGSVAPFLADESYAQQAYITSEPCVARAKGAEVTFLRAAEAGWNPYGVLVAVPDPAPPWAKAFVDATQAGWEAYMEAPSGANAEIAAANDQLTPDLLACITEAQAPFVTGSDGLGAMTEARWAATADTLKDLELIPAAADPSAAWTSLR